MAKPLISKILKEAGKIKDREGRIAYLRRNDHPALRDVLRIAYDSDVVSALPEGVPPYEPDDAPEGHEYQTLYRAFKRFKYFFKGPIANEVPQVRREGMFISMLETLHADEAAMLCLAKDKKLKVTGITKKLVKDAFPNLIKK
tara:strand:+ start:575 stop:1003 length:429 start_codon:yes stop_codon:yes gene_type:complete